MAITREASSRPMAMHDFDLHIALEVEPAELDAKFEEGSCPCRMVGCQSMPCSSLLLSERVAGLALISRVNGGRSRWLTTSSLRWNDIPNTR